MNLRQQLQRDEGTVLHAYQDSLGYWTIGTGRLIDQRRGGGISQEENDFLLDNDIRRVTAEVATRLPFFQRLDPARQGVLQNMAFQMGVEGLLGFRNTLRMVQEGRYDDAARGMLNSKWARQTPNRAYRLSEQMRTGVWH